MALSKAELKEIEEYISPAGDWIMADEQPEQLRGYCEKLLEEVKRLKEDRQACHEHLLELKRLKAEAMHPPMYTDQKGKEYYVLKVHPSHKITQEMIDKLDLLFPVKLDVDNSVDKEE